MQDTQFKNQLIDIDLEGKTLPAVTAADEGKVLTVDSSGAWTAAEGGGGGGGSVDIIVNASSMDFSDASYTIISGSYNDLLSKLSSGSYITGYMYNLYPDDSQYTYMPLTGVNSVLADDDIILNLMFMNTFGSGEFFTLDSENNIIYSD